MKKYIIALILLILAQTTNSQWASNYSANPLGDILLTNAHGISITVDNEGYCYITGYVNENNGEGDNILIIKYNSQTGDTIWVRSFNGSANNNDIGKDIIVDGYGNVYITGSAQDLNTGSDVILLKYNSVGELLWNETYSGNQSIYAEDAGNALALDNYGNIYVTGYCTNADALHDIILLKYNSSGYLVWNKKEDGSDDLLSEGFNLAVDNFGLNIYVLGFITRNQTQSDIALIRYNINGSQYFIEYLNGSGNSEDRAFGIAVDDMDNVIITGYVTTDAISGITHSVTTKFNSSGNIVWSVTNESQTSDRAFGIAVDQDGATYITGYITNSNGNKDYLTIAYNSSGEQIWNATYNGPGNLDDEASAIGIVNNSIIVTGSSLGLNNNYDYATVNYSKTTGDFQSESRYSMTEQTEDVAKDLAIDSDNNAYITGYSQLLGDLQSGSAVSTLKIKPLSGNKSISNDVLPSDFKLLQNYPNPFNPSTSITFSIPGNRYVQLKIYDVTGRIVSTLINEYREEGTYEVRFDAHNLASGIYFYELKAGNFRGIRKMTLIK